MKRQSSQSQAPQINLNKIPVSTLEKCLYNYYSLRIAHHTKSITILKLTSDNKYLFSGSEDCKILQFSILKSRYKYEFSGHKFEITSIEHHGSTLYSSDLNSIIIWDLKQRTKLSSIDCSSPITNMILVPSLSYLLASHEDASISVYNSQSQSISESLFKLGSSDSSISALLCIESTQDTFQKFSIISGHYSGLIQIQDLQKPQTPLILKGHTKQITQLCCNSAYLVSSSEDKSLHVWSIPSFSFKSKLEGHTWPVSSCLLTSNNKYIISASADNSIILWCLHQFRQISVLKSSSWYYNSIVCTSDSKTLFSSGFDCTIRVWDLKKLKLAHELTGHVKEVKCFNFNANFCVTGGKDFTVRLWDLQSRGQRLVMRGHEEVVTIVRVDDLGNWVCSASQDLTLKLWRAKDGACCFSYRDHRLFIDFLQVGGKFARVLTVDTEGLWVLRSWKRKKCLDRGKMLFGRVCSGRFSRSERFWVTEHGDGVWAVWNVKKGLKDEGQEKPSM